MPDSQQRYRVIERLESGGMAEVFRAESEGLQGFRKQVAIKRVLPHLSSKKKFISMFLDEARLSAQLSHSNCVQVFDIGVGDAAFFIVMEFVDGANLKSIFEHLKKNGRDFPVEAAAHIALEICKGLAYAHELTDSSGTPLHIVHRDMSPPNVLITKYGEVKIVDFGLAKANSQLEKSEPGIIKGKFSYLSPEAAMGQDVDARTDIFAVGIILWELLAGQRLFLGDTDFQTVKKVQAAQVPSISQINPKVPADLERIIGRALARDPAHRYASARALGVELSKFMFRNGTPVSTFDIEQLARSAIKERARYRPQQHSIIDKLIEEALFEFTSLTDDQGGGGGGADANTKSAPLLVGTSAATGSWIDQISPTIRKASQTTSTLSLKVTEGNLAALEDDEPPKEWASSLVGGPRPGSRPPSHPPGAALVPPAARGLSDVAVPAAAPPPRDHGRRTNVTSRIGVIVAVVILAAASAAAWFSHSSPHP